MLGLLLRSGADETIVIKNGYTATDVAGVDDMTHFCTGSREQSRVRLFVACARFGRQAIWRRKKLLVLWRAFFGRG